MFQFGLYKDVENIKEIIPPLIHLLNGAFDVTTEEEGNYVISKLKNEIQIKF